VSLTVVVPTKPVTVVPGAPVPVAPVAAQGAFAPRQAPTGAVIVSTPAGTVNVSVDGAGVTTRSRPHEPTLPAWAAARLAAVVAASVG
jgi:hypothetical protein